MTGVSDCADRVAAQWAKTSAVGSDKLPTAPMSSLVQV